MAQQNSSIRFECPSCGGRVKVPPGQAGQTCQCPRCNAKIVAPGGGPVQQPRESTPTIDDDFFAEDPIAPPPAPPAPSPNKPQSQGKAEPQQKAVSPQDVNSGREPKAKPSRPQSNPQKPTKTKAAKPQPARQATERLEFGVDCALCSTRIYATLDQVGKTLKCPDCHSKVLVRAPKKRPEPTQYQEREDEDDFGLSEPVERPPSDYAANATALPDSAETSTDTGPSQKEANRPMTPGTIMDDAARQTMAKAEAEERAKPVLPDQPFKTGMISFFFDPAAGVRWLLLTLMGHGFVASLFWTLALASGGAIQQFGAVFFTVVVVGLGLGFLLLSTACSVAIIQDTANGYEKIEQWPGANIGEWMWDGFYVTNSLLASATPGVAVWLLGLGWVNAVFVGTATAVALFPILVLSALEQSSPLGFASASIWKSLGERRGRWVKFYLLSVGLAVLALLASSLLPTSNFLLWGLAAAGLATIGMVYFRLVGRLAWCLSEPEEAQASKSGKNREQSDANEGVEPQH